MFDHAAGALKYDCPEHRRAVITGITTDKATLARLAGLKLSVWCPHCANSHIIDGKDASVFWGGTTAKLRVAAPL